MDAERTVLGLTGAAFLARAFSGARTWVSRLGYALVAYDLLASAAGNKTALTGARLGQLRRAERLPRMEARKARTISERVRYIHEQALTGTRQPEIYQYTRRIMSRKCGNEWCVPEKDAVAEMTALFANVRQDVRYLKDPVNFDSFQTPAKTLELGGGDCIPVETLVLGAGYKLREIGDLSVGDSIMGNGTWTRVVQVWPRSRKRTLIFELDNGCALRCSTDHRLFVVRPEGTSERRAGSVHVGEHFLSPGGSWKQHPKVKAIREGPLTQMVDIETDSHQFYLPESDVVVHNCDDMTALIEACCMQLGYRVKSRIVHTKGEATWNHIYPMVQLPNSNWMSLDASVNRPAGWEVPSSMLMRAPLDFDVPVK